MSVANVKRKHELSQGSRPAKALVYEKRAQPCVANNYAPKPRNASSYPASQVGYGLARRHFRAVLLQTGTDPPGNAHAGKPQSRAGTRGAIVRTAEERWANPAPEEIQGHRPGGSISG